MLQRLCSIETGPEEQFVETRHAHVRDTAADLMVRREDGTEFPVGFLATGDVDDSRVIVNLNAPD